MPSAKTPFPGCHLEPRHFSESATSLRALAPSSVWHQEGHLPVIVTSVHGYPHQRDGTTKAADTGSLELSHLLAHISGAHWLAVGQPGEEDSNHHRSTTFKAELAHLVARMRPVLVVDVHGSHAGRPFDVDVGSLRGESWLHQKDGASDLFQALQVSGFFVTDNAVFRAEGSTPLAQTVTAFVARDLGVPAVQLEISSALLAELGTRQALHQHAKLVNALADFLKRIAGPSL